MPPLSIITVVKDDPNGLKETYESVLQNIRIGYEHVIWIHPSGIDQYDLSAIYEDPNAIVEVSEDNGIFDAMNKATSHATGNYVLYLNAGDTFIAPLKDEPKSASLIKVFYHDFRGSYKPVKRKKTVKMGIPYCHQGIIFRNSDLRYKQQRFASDYILVLDSIRNWYKVDFLSGAIYYRNDGVSAVNRRESDIATAAVIRERFGFPFAQLFMGKSIAKLAVKRVHKIAKSVARIGNSE